MGKEVKLIKLISVKPSVNKIYIRF